MINAINGRIKTLYDESMKNYDKCIDIYKDYTDGKISVEEALKIVAGICQENNKVHAEFNNLVLNYLQK